MAIAGAAGPGMEMVRLFQTELEHYEKVEGEPLSLEGKANKLSQMIRANLPAAMQGLVVVPLFCGYDLRRQEGRLFKYDVTGGNYEEADYATTGSGSVHAELGEGRLPGRHVPGGGRRPRPRWPCSRRPTRTRPPAGPTSCGASSRPWRWSTANGYVKLADDDVEQRSIALLQSGRSAL